MYWEYTKMHYTVRMVIWWPADIVDRLFEGLAIPDISPRASHLSPGDRLNPPR